MSNLIHNFPSKLTAVYHYLSKNGKHVYKGHFEDGSTEVIRNSGREYKSVTQIGTLGGRTDFLFSAKLAPSLRSFEQERHIATVQVQKLATYEVPEHLRCRVEDL
jgi:hypothetical protein